jgi:hypothetical protein
VNVEDREPAECVVVAVVEGGADEVPAAGGERPERVAAARAGGAGEVPHGEVPVGQALYVVRRVDAGVEPRVGEAGVGYVAQAARGLVVVRRVVLDAAVDADEPCRRVKSTSFVLS